MGAPNFSLLLLLLRSCSPLPSLPLLGLSVKRAQPNFVNLAYRLSRTQQHAYFDSCAMKILVGCRYAMGRCVFSNFQVSPVHKIKS